MFGDDRYFNDMAELLLTLMSFEELLEMNNLTEDEVLTILLEGGYIGEPSRVLDGQEGEGTDEEEEERYT